MADSTTSRSSSQICQTCGSGPKTASGVLSRCAKCKVAHYCSKACQAADRPTHKLACKKPVTTISYSHSLPYSHPLPTFNSSPATPGELAPGIMVLLNPEPGIAYDILSISPKPGATWRETLSSLHFCESLTSSAIGYPLELALFPTKDGVSLPLSYVIDALTVNVTPASPDFGKALVEPGISVGSMLLVRCDEQWMNPLHVTAVLNYLGAQVLDLQKAGQSEVDDGEIVKRRELVDKVLAPEAFVCGWEVFKQLRVVRDKGGWADLECPVQPNGSVTAVLVKMVSDKQKAIKYTLNGTLLEADSKADSPRQNLPITTALGLGLSMIKIDNVGLQVRNTGVRKLCMDVDPSSPTFGEFDARQMQTGAVLLVRDDGQPLRALHVKAVIEYVRSSVLPVMRTVAGLRPQGVWVNQQEAAGMLLSPAAFVAKYEAIKKNGIDSGEIGWEGLECPVQVSAEDVAARERLRVKVDMNDPDVWR
ncbi:hypothetical protein LTR53_011606 [Teratosphaeriaceae sp. CCFEE 6253]|nr:hypothetical protein LTR53_011606 [Teratosphaeriaceae sp. CCFEE 6253]